MRFLKRLVFNLPSLPVSQLFPHISIIQPYHKYFTRLISVSLTFLAFQMDAAQARPEESPQQESIQQESILGRWWHGRYATGDWFGARTYLEDRGVTLRGNTTSIYYGVPTHSLRNNSVYCYDLQLGADFDFGKMFGLAGLRGQIGFQWETGEEFFFKDRIGAGTAFNPTAFAGYLRWRLKPIDLTYVTPELFGIKEFLTISGGWQNPKDYFILQPSANFFRNNAFGGGFSIVENDVAFDGNYVAWGGYTKVKPRDWFYVQAGLWAAVPNALDWQNRGVYFALAQPPRNNGLFFMGETGFTPQWGKNRLPGKYAFGGYYWGLSCPSFFGASYPGRFGFYWQADQMLYREPSSVFHVEALSKDSTLFDNTKEKLSSQGLYAFGLITYAPKFNNILPFFFRTGLVYKGLIPTRDQDKIGIAFAFGNYSYYKILANRAHGKYIQRTYAAVLEVDYQFQINKWLYAQPFLEYIMRPYGNGVFKDALVLGIAANLVF